jgi:metal-responsive CopG/Arc/MetJ family transcriptional regulator
MKAIQITIDEPLLKRLDQDDEVRRDGRSAVLRRAAAAYLQRKRNAAVARAYHRAYAENTPLGEEFAGWEDEGVWPEEK